MDTYFDRDFVETPEGFLFCVIGCVHPKDRVIAYLKYVPDVAGKWGREQRRFRRTMQTYSIPQVLSNIEMLKQDYPQYVFNSRILNIMMSAVPRRLVKKHFKPRERLSQLLVSSVKDDLEKDVVDLVNELSQDSGVDRSSFGITGSVLTDIHHVDFSDIDITVYGLGNSTKIKKAVKSKFNDQSSNVKPLNGVVYSRTAARWIQNYGLSSEEASWFARRKWNRGIFRDRLFSLHPVLSAREVKEKYGDKRFYPCGIVEGEALIVDSTESVFLPSKYRLNIVKIKPHLAFNIEEIVSYEGFYSGIFNVGDSVTFRGKLEKAIDRNTREEKWRILIGSIEAEGCDYILPNLDNHNSRLDDDR
jgi:predicted nucleotidyltransferase